MKVELQAGGSITIPQGCKAVIKDGSVVFEKEEKKQVQEFKDGDVLIDDCTFSEYPCKIIMIYKGIKSKDKCYKCYIHRNMNGSLIINGDCCNAPSAKVRYATEEEKQLLFDKMKEQGLKWDAEEKKVEKIRWRAKYGEPYWYVTSSCSVAGDFMREENSLTGSGAIEDWSGYNHFRKKAQAAEAAKRVKETLKKYCEEIGE